MYADDVTPPPSSQPQFRAQAASKTGVLTPEMGLVSHPMNIKGTPMSKVSKEKTMDMAVALPTLKFHRRIKAPPKTTPRIPKGI